MGFIEEFKHRREEHRTLQIIKNAGSPRVEEDVRIVRSTFLPDEAAIELASRAAYLASEGDPDAIAFMVAAVETDINSLAPGEIDHRRLPPPERTLPVLEVVKLTLKNNPDSNFGIQQPVVERLLETAPAIPLRTPFETIIQEGVGSKNI